MEKNNLQVPDLILKSGIDVFGFIKLDELKDENSLNYYNNRPEDSINEFEDNPINKFSFSEFGELNNVIVCLMPYYRKNRLNNKGFSIYTRSLDYHTVANNKLEKTISYIKKIGYEAKLYVDSNSLPERLISIKAGLTKALKNGLVYNKKYGSFFFICEILTNLDIDIFRKNEKNNNANKLPNELPNRGFIHDFCLTCDRCVKACPKEVLGDKYLKVNKCLSYLTQSKNLKFGEYDKFNGRLFGCDTCQIVCPLNDFKLKDLKIGLNDFEPFTYLEDPNLYEIANLSKKDFIEKYKKISASWRGKTLLQRNALISLINEGEDIDINKINAPKLKEEIKGYLEYKSKSEV